MSAATVLLSIDGGIARLTLNRPDRFNSFTVQMHQELSAALEQLSRDKSVRVLILSGAGKAFCSGQDLNERRAVPGHPPADLGESIDKRYRKLILTLRDFPVPVIAAVNGVASGAGANLALVCDLVVAARSANFIQPFTRLGLMPDAGATWLLPRLVGPARARGMTLLAEPLSATTAEAWGLIWRCVDDADLQTTVDAMAQRLLSAAPLALQATRQALWSSWNHTLEENFDVEASCQRGLGYSQDYAEGVAAFFSKRTPQFRGE